MSKNDPVLGRRSDWGIREKISLMLQAYGTAQEQRAFLDGVRFAKTALQSESMQDVQIMFPPRKEPTPLQEKRLGESVHTD